MAITHLSQAYQKAKEHPDWDMASTAARVHVGGLDTSAVICLYFAVLHEICKRTDLDAPFVMGFLAERYV